MTKALLRGVLAGLVTWLIYGLLFEMIIEHAPLTQALFSRNTLIFAAAVVVLDTILNYRSLSKKKQ